MIRSPRSLDEAENVMRVYHEYDSNISNLADAIGKPRTTVNDWITRSRKIINQKGYEVPDNQNVKGFSTLYKVQDDGSRTVAMEWVKTDQQKEDTRIAFDKAIESLNDKIEPVKAKRFKGGIQDDLCTLYMLTDFHLGMMAWQGEAGDDWDLDIAEQLMFKYFDYATIHSPDSKVGVLCNLGDFLHWDGLEAVTPASKHVLDASCKYSELVQVAIKSIRNAVNMMLDKHEIVHLIMAEGNHDEASSVWLRSLFTVLYENEPRVKIDNTHTPYYCYEWGDTSLFFHHGHKKRIGQLGEVFAGMYRDVFGRTKHSYGHMGHFHHAELKENSLMVIEQHRTLASKDSYAARGGYVSKRAANVITYHKEYGEFERRTIKPEML